MACAFWPALMPGAQSVVPAHPIRSQSPHPPDRGIVHYSRQPSQGLPSRWSTMGYFPSLSEGVKVRSSVCFHGTGGKS